MKLVVNMWIFGTWKHHTTNRVFLPQTHALNFSTEGTSWIVFIVKLEVMSVCWSKNMSVGVQPNQAAIYIISWCAYSSSSVTLKGPDIQTLGHIRPTDASQPHHPPRINNFKCMQLAGINLFDKHGGSLGQARVWIPVGEARDSKHYDWLAWKID